MENDQPVKSVNENGTERWHFNYELHRVDGPAVTYTNGNEFWYLNGKRHRVNGPAIKLKDGTEYWSLNGVEISEEDFRKAHSCTREDLPLFLGTTLEPIAKWRLENGK